MSCSSRTRMTHHSVAAPRYSLSRIFALRERLANDVLSEFCGFAPEGRHFEELVDLLCEAIPRVDRLVMWDSVRSIAGCTLREENLRNMCWRIAGNVELLRTGVAVPPWHLQQEAEWAPVQVLAWEPARSARGRRGGRFTMRILAGTACPMRVRTFWTVGFCRFIARRAGYTARRHGLPFAHPSELVNLRIWVQIEPDRCRPGVPGFQEVGCTSSLRKWNRQIIKMRFRRDWACPHNYTHYCYQCPVGYMECPAATHAETHDARQQSDAGGS